MRSITFRNEGGAELMIGELAGENELIEPSTISEDSCSLQTIDPGASCSITLTYVPVALGDFSDTFDVPSDDPDVAFTILSVKGSGVSRTMDPDDISGNDSLDDPDADTPGNSSSSSNGSGSTSWMICLAVFGLCVSRKKSVRFG